jgi:diguanylate cyclase (GGDEF)-like protein
VTSTADVDKPAKGSDGPASGRLAWRETLALFFGLALMSASALALNPNRLPTQYIHDHYTRADGLPAGAVWSVTQDDDGYLWLGSQNGLARFDGVRFEVFDASNTRGMQSQDIRDIVFDQRGQMWLGSYGGGVYRFDPDRRRLEALTSEDGLPNNVVYDLLVDREGALWAATAGGLARISGDDRVETWTSTSGLSNDRVFKLYQDRQGRLWVATFGGGVSYFDGQRFTHFDSADGLASNQVHSVYQDRRGRILVGSYEGGFQEYVSGRFVDIELPEGMAGLAIQSILEDGNNNLWLGAYGNGLIRYRDGEVAHLNFDALERTVISAMVEDAEGSLWLATREGLQRLRDGKVTVYGRPEGLADTTFVVTGSPKEDVVWVGTEGAGLFALGDSTIQRFTRADNGLASDNIAALQLAPNGDLWTSSFGLGINRIRDGLVDRLGADQGLPSGHVFAFQFDARGRLWAATAAGVSRFDGERFVNFGAEAGLPSSAVRQLFFDDDGQLWIGTNGQGVAVLSDEGIRIPDVNADLPGSIVHAFHQDRNGRLWIGFRDGGLALLREGQPVFSFGIDQGLSFRSINSILEDGGDNLWLATSAGLLRVAMEDLIEVADGQRERIEPMVFTEADGLRSVQFVGGFQPTSWRDENGHLWFASAGGLVRVDPDQLALNDRPPPVRIEGVRADGMTFSANQPIELTPDVVNIEIDYTGLSLVSPDQVIFRYRLLGYDRDWQEVADRRTAYYTGLPKGDYVFQVLARNNDGVWSPEPAQLTIVQRARFYEQIWFLALCAALAIAAMVGSARLWVLRSRLREARLAEEVRERTLQLEQALQEVERTSRIDGLTGVANRGYFEDRLERAWSVAQSERHPLGLIMIDIDRFKKLNDTHGHQVGDDALRRVALTLTEKVHRSGDLVARYGGEEFVVLLPGADLEDAGELAESMRQAVSELSGNGDPAGSALAMTISAGVAALSPEAGGSAKALIGAADDALYRAKRNGRNRVELAA